MNKETFLIQLEKMLYDIPKEERDEAMDYYRSYFDDAGVENEALVIEELESPQAIAASIKEGLNAGGDMSAFLKNPPQVREETAQSGTYKNGKQQNPDSSPADSPFGSSAYASGSYQGASAGAGASGSFQNGASGAGASGSFQNGASGAGASGSFQNGASGAGTSGGTFYRRYNESENKYNKGAGRTMDKTAKIILIIILAICTLPVWGGIFSVTLGIAGTVIAAVIVLGICSVVFLIGGIICAVVGILRLCTLSLVYGLLTFGTGLLLVAGSGISFVLLFLLCGRLLPWAVRTGIELCRRLFQFVGRSMA